MCPIYNHTLSAWKMFNREIYSVVLKKGIKQSQNKPWRLMLQKRSILFLTPKQFYWCFLANKKMPALKLLWNWPHMWLWFSAMAVLLPLLNWYLKLASALFAVCTRAYVSFLNIILSLQTLFWPVFFEDWAQNR